MLQNLLQGTTRSLMSWEPLTAHTQACDLKKETKTSKVFHLHLSSCSQLVGRDPRGVQ